MSHTLRPAGDDDPVVMTAEERSVWVYLTAVVGTFIVYLAIMVPRLLSQPLDQVSWKAPLIGVLIASIISTIVGSILGAIGGAIGLAIRGIDPTGQLDSDARDKDIARLGSLRGAGAAGVGLFSALVLALFEVDHIWIANAVFLAGTAGALVETTTKIRAYRRGF